jgi:hypothetical protein
MVRLHASYDRIKAMKAAFPAHVTDSNPPNVTAPASGLLAGGTLGGVTAAVGTAWSAADGCRISAYGLQRQTGTGTWVGQSLPGSLSTSVVQGLRFGVRYRYAATATDGAGNVSVPVAGTSFRVRRIQETDPAIQYHGAWQLASDPQSSGDQFASSMAAGAKATFTFTGSSASWVAVRGPSRGVAAVFVDGAFAGRINLHATARHARQVVFARTWADTGTHRITIVNRATVGHPGIAVDAFVTLAP